MMTKRIAWCLVAAVVAAGPVAAEVVYYPSSDGINLLKHVNTATGQLDTKVEWVEDAMTNSGRVEYNAFHAIDAGTYQTQVNYNNQSNSTNAASLRFELATPQAIGTLTQYMGDIPDKYQVWGFNEIDGTWTNLSGGWRAGSATITTNVNGTYKYIQLDYVGTPNHYIRVGEVIASPMAGAQIALTDGYNLLAYRPVLEGPGGPGPIPTSDPLYYSGWRIGHNPNDLVNNQWNNGMLVQENIEGNAGKENFFVLPLNDLYSLIGFATGAYHGQQWSGITIQYTADATISETTQWFTAYTQSTSIGSASIAFTNKQGEATPIDARFIRVITPTLTSGNGALTGFELYATSIPEPATMGLLALGGLALLRRRK